VRQFLAQGLAPLLAEKQFLAIIPGHLGGTAAADERAERVVAIMAEICQLGQTEDNKKTQ